MHLQREFSMALSPSGYKTYVTGEDCHVAATAAIKNMIEETMDVQLGWQMRRQWKKHGRRSDRRNGYYERNLLTSWGWIVGIRVPRARVSTVAGEVIPRYQRRQVEFDAAVLSSFMHGHSTRKSVRFFKDFFKEMGVSHTTVSRIVGRLDELCGAWRRRVLEKPYSYLWLDGKCAKICKATKRPYSVLWAYGACPDGQRELLGFQIHRSEGTAHWESLLFDLVNRGLDPQKLKLVVRDENSGCEQAVLSFLGDVPQQSCSVHLERNLGKLVSKPYRSEFCAHVSEIFKQNSLQAARQKYAEVMESWGKEEPEACLYLQGNVDKSLVFYTVADSVVWRAHLKSTNILERFFRELKRFEKGRQFRYANEASCMRFYYAYAKLYNDKHTHMPKPSKKKRGTRSTAYQLTRDLHNGSPARGPRNSRIQSQANTRREHPVSR